MRRLMSMIEHRRVDLTPLVTHRFSLDDIAEAVDLFSHQADGVMKIALHSFGQAAGAELVTAGAMDAEC